MIKRIKGLYVVLSAHTHLARSGRRKRRVFGRYKTKGEAERRLRQVEFFKRRVARKKGRR